MKNRVPHVSLLRRGISTGVPEPALSQSKGLAFETWVQLNPELRQPS
jgi:hypothetical protein